MIIQVYISLHVFPSTTNLKLHNISETPKMVKKVITNLDMLKASGHECIAAVVLKNCESDLLYILAQIFNKSLKEPCLSYCWKVSLVVSVFKTVGESYTIKNYPGLQITAGDQQFPAIFCFTSHLPIYLLVNMFYTICEWA